jgi:hypothetical protein
MVLGSSMLQNSKNNKTQKVTKFKIHKITNIKNNKIQNKKKTIFRKIKSFWQSP